MKKTFSRLFALALIVSIVVSVFSGLTVTVDAAGANKNSGGVARALSDEGIVLMKNENNALPLKQGANIAIFGEGQHLRLYTAEDFDHDNSMGIETLQKQHGYIPWGAGSSRAMGVGGKDAAVDPLDALKMAEELGRINIYDEISQGYIDALETSNSDESFVEYIPTEADYQAAVNAGVDTAIVVISRFDGECVDMPVSDWNLYESEKSVLQNATKYFDKVIVVLNTPTPIDTSWAFENDLGIEVDSILFAGYGGMQGGYAIADVILGDVNPSGKLVTTYAKDLYDYPTTETFINDSKYQKYTEDIFLGYRYFETFDPTYSKVNFEFGFGLSYTTFDIKTSDFKVENGVVTVKATVTNTGDKAGKEVVQMYLSAPQGVLGKAAKVLCGFDKTQLLQPGESETLLISVELNDLASYDDLGKTGNKSAYVLEAGDYKFYVGNSVKEAGTRLAGTHNISELVLVEQLSEQAKTNLDKRLLADGTFENLQTGTDEPTEPGAPVEAPTHEIGTALRIEAEDWCEKPYSTNASYTGKTESFTGVLYNKLTNTWDKLSGVTFSQAYMIQSVKYKVIAETAGEYKISVRYASNKNNDTYEASDRTPKISVATSVDNVTFGTASSFACQKTSLIGGNAYNSYMDSNELAITLNEGVNYIKLNVSHGPNIDSFFIYYSGAGQPVDGSAFIEAEDYYEIVDNGTTVVKAFTNGWYYNGTDVTSYSQACIESLWPSKSYVTYKLNVIESGRYKMVARCSANAVSGLDVLTSTDGTTFTNPLTLENIVVPEDTRVTTGKTGYYCFVDYAVDGYIYLTKGTNYIKFAKGTATACNIDLFTLEKVYPTTVVESEEYVTIDSTKESVDVNKNGKLYNEETGTWDAYVASNLANGWAAKEATYTVYIENPGEYTVNAICASNNGNTGKMHIASEVDNFTRKATVAVTDTKTESGSQYYGYKLFNGSGTITLKKGFNTIKLTFSSVAPNVDKFTLVRTGDTPVKPLINVVNGTITLDDFVEQMTNDELATFYVSYAGLNFGGSNEVNSKYGFSRVAVSDGPSGIGSKGSSFPCETVIACTWNTDLVEAFGRVMGAELYDNNVEVWLAPGVNLHRNPLSGRNSEYYSEDPFISGIMAVTTIKAVQRYGVSVCIKHFVCNEKEGNKLASDSRVSERALREIYLKPFEMAVKDGKAQGIMSSYNLVNGVAMNENKDILTNILRGEWGYQYYISGDWNNNKDMVKEINAGHGVREPYSYCDIDTVIAAINNGEISRETLLTGAKYELNTLMRGKRNYSNYGSVCNGNHNYVNDVCSVCHAPDPMVFKNLDATLNSLVDNMTQTVGYKLNITESTVAAGKDTIIQGKFITDINVLTSDRTRAELTICNTMASKANLKVKMGIFVADSSWTRVTVNDSKFSFTGDSDVFYESGWLNIPYGATATLYYDLSDSKYDTFVGVKDGVETTYTRNDYRSIIYLLASDAQAGDSLYLKGDHLNFAKSTIVGTTVETVNTDISFNGAGTYNVESRLLGDYGKVLDSKLLSDAGLTITNGQFFDGKVNANYVLKATDNADYIFNGWYDADNNLISTEKLIGYNTLSVPAGENTIYAQYTIKGAKASENKIKGATLDIGSSLTINYYADLDEAHKNAKLNVTRNNTTVTISGTYDSKTGLYLFAYEGINPQCMTDTVDAELIYNGEVISSKADYSVKAYANNLMGKTAADLKISQEKYDALKTLLSDMLFYGDSAQYYQNYRVNELATNGIEWLETSTYAAPTDGVKRVVAGNNDENNKILSSGLNMANVNKIYFKVTVTDADVDVYVDGKLVTPDSEGKVYTNAIVATRFDETHSAELKKGVDTIAKVEYNVNAYIMAKSENATVGDIVKALNNYGVAAKSYASIN